VLVFHGADDSFISPDQVRSFQEEMRRARADWQMVFYGGAVHSFTVPEAGNDPSKGMAYNAAADKRSWQALKDFLAETFR
jgi:dienelactone hydrolase